jgi:hypothetical protein
MRFFALGIALIIVLSSPENAQTVADTAPPIQQKVGDGFLPHLRLHGVGRATEEDDAICTQVGKLEDTMESWGPGESSIRAILPPGRPAPPPR